MQVSVGKQAYMNSVHGDSVVGRVFHCKTCMAVTRLFCFIFGMIVVDNDCGSDSHMLNCVFPTPKARHLFNLN